MSLLDALFTGCTVGLVAEEREERNGCLLLLSQRQRTAHEPGVSDTD